MKRDSSVLGNDPTKMVDFENRVVLLGDCQENYSSATFITYKHHTISLKRLKQSINEYVSRVGGKDKANLLG